jgi:polyisoprenoid-binding protein YceI
MSAVSAPEVTATTTWNIDPVHSTAQFKVKHMMISNVKGEFTTITGKLELNGSDINKSRVEASIDAGSINTREAQRDAHLKSADFLDVEKFPALAFKSTRISKISVDEIAVEGDLSIHGVTRNVVFEVEGPSAPIKDPWATRASASLPRRPSSGKISGWLGTRLSKRVASWWAKKSTSPWMLNSSKRNYV